MQNSGKNIKVITIVGARPQFVKAAALSRKMAENKAITEVLVHTGQHYDTQMSDVFFDEMQITKPHYFLGVNDKSHGAMTGQMIEKIEEVLLLEKPDWVIVFGDTNSTLAGAIAAKKLHIKIAHVEAGLRSYNNLMPEEINRILTDRISDVLFCPTQKAYDNLVREGFLEFDSKLIISGDIMEDAAIHYSKLITDSSILKQIGITPQNYILATIHRAENTDNIDRLFEIISALNELSQSIDVVMPIHPRTQKRFKESGIDIKFTIIDPIGYFDMITLLKNCNIVITDSGGLQKEAFFFGKFCLTSRDETEWIELVENGYNFICGANRSKIAELYMQVIHKVYPDKINLYGNGEAAKNIIDYLISN